METSPCQEPSPCVSVASTDIDLLLWLKDTIGKGKIIRNKNYNIEKHKNSYTYKMTYNDAIELLKDIEPYLVILKKKLRAKLIIEKYKKVNPRNERYCKEMKKLKAEFYEEFMSI